VISLLAPWNIKETGNFITAIAQDSKGSFWFGSEEHGVVRLHADQITHFTQKDGLGDDNGYAIAIDADDNVWVGTLNHGVSKYDGKTWTTYGVLDGLGGSHVYSLAVGTDGKTIWCGTENGVARFDGKTWRMFGIADGLPWQEITALAVAEDGTVWGGGAMRGLSRYDGKRWERIGRERGLRDERINGIHISRAGKVWVATCNGVACYDPKREAFEEVPEAPEGFFGFDDNYATCVTEDQTGAIWFGTRRGGLVRYEADVGMWESFTLFHGLPDDYVSCAMIARDGQLWFGTYGAGVCSAQPEEFVAARKTEPRCKAGAPAPVERIDWDKQEYAGRLDRVTKAAAGPRGAAPMTAYLGEDRQTRGDWIGNYGRYFYVLAGMNRYSDMSGGHGEGAVRYNPLIGDNRGEQNRSPRWVVWPQTDKPKCLRNPRAKDRRQAEWTDHGNMYPIRHDGPHLYINLSVETGVYRLALYFVNKDAHELQHKDFDGRPGAGRFRDYTVAIKKWTRTAQDTDQRRWRVRRVVEKGWAPPDNEFEAQPTLASCRVHQFVGGVYKRFLITGPATYRIRISRDGSTNTTCSGLFLDRLDEDDSLLKSLAQPGWADDTLAIEEEPADGQPQDKAKLSKIYLGRARRFYAAVHNASRKDPAAAASTTEHLLYLCNKLRSCVRLLGPNENTLEMQRILMAAIRDAGAPHIELIEADVCTRLWRDVAVRSHNKAKLLADFQAAAEEFWKLHCDYGGTVFPHWSSDVGERFWRGYFRTVAKVMPAKEAISKLRSMARMSYRQGRPQGRRLNDLVMDFVETDMTEFQHSYDTQYARARNLETRGREKEAIEAFKLAAGLAEKAAQKARCSRNIARLGVNTKDDALAQYAVDILRATAPGSREVQYLEFALCLKIIESGDAARARQKVDEFVARYPKSNFVKSLHARAAEMERSGAR